MVYHQRFKTLEERFWEKVSFGFGEDACWLWTSSMLSSKYGRFWSGKRQIKAHRMSWELCYGEIPNSLFVCHHCDNPRCVNPKHLFIGTFGDNMQDMWDKNRHPTINMGRPSETMMGDKNINVKLSRMDVLWIREMYNVGEMSITSIGRAYEGKVQLPAIWKIVHRKTWAHI